MLALIVPAVLVGAVLQRICGTGVGLVVAPLFAVLLGGAAGVLLTNATTFVSGALLTLALRHQVNWQQWALLCGTGLIGTVPGAWLVSVLPGPVLQMGVGLVVLAALGITASRGTAVTCRGPWVTTAAGAAAGLLNVTAGVAAPAVVIYSRVTGWAQKEFAATLQPVFMTLALTSLTSKWLLGAGGGLGEAGLTPKGEGLLLAGVAAAVLVGLWLGGILARRTPVERARALAMVLAAAGAVVATVRGLLGLMG